MIDRLRFKLSKHFGAKNVLDDFALEVHGGEFVTFLGPSGCGKSTALNLLAGLLQPTAGEIWLDDERLDPLPPERRGFGMVFPNYALFPHLSVFDRIVVMREGRVMQVGAPADIHDRPRNLFVADFVGYRNVLTLMVTARGVDGLVTAEGSGLRVRGRAEIGPGGAVLAAVRPEDVRLSDDAGAVGGARGMVRLVEYQGREYDVEVVLDSGAVLKARGPAAPKIGDAVGLALEPGRVVLLTPEHVA